ncbi:hypothetical protein GCM10009792_15720 [Microcella alkalica]|uniref:hypothetical protein n=1 Tax=Microcella alkalica TaxID=355930 RepID=UPI0031E3F818
MVSIDASPTAERRGRRWALGLAIASIVVAAIATTLWSLVITRSSGSQSDLSLLSTALGTGVAPLLAAASAAVTLHGLRVLARLRATVIIALATVSFPLVALTAQSWSLGFDLADAGAPMTGLAAATAPLLLVAAASGAALLGVLVHALARHAGILSSSAVGIAPVAALVGVPLVGWGFLVPSSSAAIAVGALLLAALTSPLTSPRTPPVARIRRSGRRGARLSGSSRDRLAVGIARLAAGAGVLGIAFALAGPLWRPVPIDGTEAMIVGISILLAAGAPLTASLALLVEARLPVARSVVRGPAIALILALALMGYWYTSGPDGDANWWAVSVASIFVGVAVGGMSALLPVGRPVALVVGLGVALTLAAAQVAALLPTLAFAVPVLAIVVLALDARATRSREREGAPVATA